jgi:predicted MPP superfamily phosphohydrolase
VRTVAHVSDLHFGRLNPVALAPLRRRLEELSPDLVVVSGDLTQRARKRQFRAARAYLDTLPRPQLVVPGNHDVPFYNVLARFLAPLGGYRRNIAREEEPSYIDEEIAVLGVNTSRSLVWKGGKISAAQLARVANTLAGLSKQVRVVVTHHPCAALKACPVDIVVSGHFHASRAEADGVVQVHAGTATSSRTRAEPNSFNLLRIAPERVEVEHYEMRRSEFVRAQARAFVRNGNAWT